MNLRKIIHPQVRDNYRVILEGDDGDFEIGSIGIQHAAGSGYFRAWGIDTVIPMRARLLIRCLRWCVPSVKLWSRDVCYSAAVGG